MHLPNHQESIWLESMLDRSNMTASYKAFWLQGIIEEIVVGNDRMTFHQVVCRMIATAWYPIVQFRLNFGVQDKLGDVVDYLNSTYHYGADIKKDKLLEELLNSGVLAQDKTFQTMKNSLYNMVPYRLIAPFFRKETSGLKDQKKNRLIAQLSQDSNEAFYKIDVATKSIQISSRWFDYIYANQILILGWLQYKLIIYLQHKNPSVPSIPMKLEPASQRNLARATKYWDAVRRHMTIRDIYTNELFTEEHFTKMDTMSIDHFIPWSFVMHDEMWNLIPTFKNTNSAKSDRLPNLDRHLSSFCNLQYDAFNYMTMNSTDLKILEDYLTIDSNKHVDRIIRLRQTVDEITFKESLKQTIMPIHQIAYNQGFEVWCG
ncbi:MAG: HNH endonuclease [Vallitaleaceae bacterium]|jgi:hypothetical protein|nr:HNH endonuclease [Vallitaleaceae bacterium]